MSNNKAKQDLKLGDDVAFYHVWEDEVVVQHGTIAGEREKWTGHQLEDFYGYPVRDCNGRPSWVLEQDIIN